MTLSENHAPEGFSAGIRVKGQHFSPFQRRNPLDFKGVINLCFDYLSFKCPSLKLEMFIIQKYEIVPLFTHLTLTLILDLIHC